MHNIIIHNDICSNGGSTVLSLLTHKSLWYLYGGALPVMGQVEAATGYGKGTGWELLTEACGSGECPGSTADYQSGVTTYNLQATLSSAHPPLSPYRCKIGQV
jgi:hypothetical protein